MNHYDQLIWDAIARLVDLARDCNIAADEEKVALWIASAMYADASPEVFRARLSEIREVAEVYVSAVAAIESAQAAT